MRAGQIALGRWHRLAAELIALIYIAVIAEIASATGAFYVLFPELGALSHDVFTRPRGTWARSPLMLAITPFLTALIGIVFTRALPYGYLSVLLTVGSSVALIMLLGVADRAGYFRRPVAARAGSQKLVVSTGRSARNGAVGRAFNPVAKA